MALNQHWMEERCHPPNRKSCRTPAQWSICLRHFNELPFLHIFQHIGGQTAGPKSFSGPIVQQLNCYEILPVVDYEPIDCSIPDIDRNLLSRGQQHLLDISNAITLGNCTEDLANRDRGPLFHSRWLTAANRVIRFYISSSDPSGNLTEIVGFRIHLKIIHACVVCHKKEKIFYSRTKTCLSSNPNITVFIRRITSSCRSNNTTKCVLYARRECSVGNACR
ncbi:hypothetical protein AVEN_153629-1 [Araneus ventricosus]|uniref:Uncharacterized protein n=1 Tax=Araneus ventricosus TaxID=182803 RepID=A0A4Y2BQF6_ARAVE|nr:hypothetical protein AVEN_153629-1 [Araneus ventricosus]